MDEVFSEVAEAIATAEVRDRAIATRYVSYFLLRHQAERIIPDNKHNMIFPLTISHILRKPDKDVPLPDIYIPLSGMHILCSATDIRNLTTYPHTKNKYRTGNITMHHYKIIFMLPVILMPSQAQKIINNPPHPCK
ncbi:hypothetical protein NMJ21_003492 [Escherichia coli]|uniref:hypothetical protein n=1 Tax=Escherichia coli TaxID=562 RepID=UPI0015E97D9A|nr:hypothetical protein [Escherichia coli]ELV0829001.1 hypothetical protein [Escherichia coli]QMG01353.1 hypothetical protein HVY68_11725 [Escherichia coli]QMG15570.1 hypothetical protein HVY65_11735 [Escherichia coli]HBD0053528.1 hypothetical protein [Escherichia coli]